MSWKLGGASLPRSGSEPGTGRRGGPRMIPVGGGKGGVGKTFMVVNLAVSLTPQILFLDLVHLEFQVGLALPR